VLLVALVFVTGALATWVSTRAALRLPMMAALRAG
jgi:hypothetical protein